MARVVGGHHRPIGGLNPAWCLRPQIAADGDVATRWEDNPVTSVSRAQLPTLAFSLKSSGRQRRSNRRRCPDAASAAAEPTSPKVGCMGQIKRPYDKAAGGAGGGSPLVISATSLLNLRRLFAGRAVVPLPGVAVAAIPPRGGGGGRAKPTRAGCGAAAALVNNICATELDPPLPVLKPAAGEAGRVCLWRRRWGEEMSLEGLHLQPQMLPPPVCIHQITAAA